MSAGEILVYIIVGLLGLAAATAFATYVAYGTLKELRRRDAVAESKRKPG